MKLLARASEVAASDDMRAEAMWRWGGVLVDSEREGSNAEGLAVWKRLVAKYPKTRAAQVAAREAVEAELLGIGVVARNFVARDVDGNSFQLTDFRGKVVVLDFWGFWCRPCREELPYMLRLKKRLADEPFEIVGVNSDTDRDRFRAQCKEFGVTWPNAFEGRTGGPISLAWHVREFPTVYILDHEGRIRAKRIRGTAIGAKVDELLAELEREKGEREKLEK